MEKNCSVKKKQKTPDTSNLSMSIEYLKEVDKEIKDMKKTIVNLVNENCELKRIIDSLKSNQ